MSDKLSSMGVLVLALEKPDRAGHAAGSKRLPSNVYTSIRVLRTFFTADTGDRQTRKRRWRKLMEG